MTSHCYFRFDHKFVSTNNTNHSNHSQQNNSNGNVVAFVASPQTVDDSSWYMDSGATYHITANLNNLSLQQDYKRKEKIVVGNGHSLPISHIGSSLIASTEKPLLLNNILYAPQITKNLLKCFSNYKRQ